MIIVFGNIITTNNMSFNYSKDSIEWSIINKLSISEEVYEYTSINQLKFEIELRIQIINSAKELERSAVKFRTFKNSICNEDYWDRTEKGGFVLKNAVSPSEGIKDIFENSSKYGTECSTAIVLVYYKALLSIYPDELFDITFPNLHLMNWHFIDDDLDMTTYKNLSYYVPGDCRYVENPQFNPEKPEWRGENLIELGDDTYFGHGLGIVSKKYVIEYLNNRRMPEASQSAFLKDNATRLNFKHLFNIYINYSTSMEWKTNN